MPNPTWNHAGDTPEGVPRYTTTNMHPDSSIPHEVQITPGTIEDRMAIYNLATEAEALEHIMWECHIELNPDFPAGNVPANIRANFEDLRGPNFKNLRGKSMSQAEQRVVQIKMNVRRRAFKKGKDNGKPTGS